MDELKEKFFVVHDFSDIPRKAYESVIDDILSIYRLYCKNRIQKNEEKAGEVEQFSIENTNIQDYSGIKYFNKTKQLIYRHVFSENETKIICDSKDTKDKTAILDDLAFSILSFIVGENDISNINFDKMYSELPKNNPGDRKKFIEKRIQALKAYFNDNLEDSVRLLNEAHTIGEEVSSIPKWLLNDVAIDLRNVEIQINATKNKYEMETKGQILLNESTEQVYYPILDRCVESYHKKVIEFTKNYKINSPYTFYLDGIEFILDKVVDAFIVSFLNCSLTQMLSIRTRLIEFYEEMSLQFHDHDIYCTLIKLLLITQNSKKLGKFIRKFGEVTNYININDIEKMMIAVNAIPITYKRHVSKLLLFQYYGYYLSDKGYAKYFTEIKSIIQNWLQNSDALVVLGKPIFDSINANVLRLSSEEILDILYNVINNKWYRWSRDVFRILNELSIETLNVKNQKTLLKWILECIENEKEIGGENSFKQAVIQIKKRLTIKTEEIDKLVKIKWPDFYKEEYDMECLEKQDLIHINRYIKIIEQRIETQGKNGCYTGFMDDPFGTIINIIMYGDIKLRAEIINKIMLVIKNTLISPRQTTKDKIGALELLIFLRGRHPKSRVIKDIFNFCEEEKVTIFRSYSRSIFGSASLINFQFSYLMAQIAFNVSKKDEVMKQLGYITQCKDSEIISALECVSKYLDQNKLPKEVLDVFIAMVLGLSYNNEKDIRFYSITILYKISKYDYQSIILNHFSKMMDNEIADIKLAIISRVKKIEITEDNKETIHAILQKGRIDNHYWVRKCVIG